MFSVKESKMEQVAGIVLAVGSAIFLFLIIPNQIAHQEGVFPSPRTFPQIITGVLIFVSILLFFSGWMKRKQENQKVYTISKEAAKMSGITLGAMCIYIIILPIISYIPATALLAASLTFIYGQRNKILGIALAIAIPVLIYLAFTNLLFLRLP